MAKAEAEGQAQLEAHARSLDAQFASHALGVEEQRAQLEAQARAIEEAKAEQDANVVHKQDFSATPQPEKPSAQEVAAPAAHVETDAWGLGDISPTQPHVRAKRKVDSPSALPAIDEAESVQPKTAPLKEDGQGRPTRSSGATLNQGLLDLAPGSKACGRPVRAAKKSKSVEDPVMLAHVNDLFGARGRVVDPIEVASQRSHADFDISETADMTGVSDGTMQDGDIVEQSTPVPELPSSTEKAVELGNPC